MTVPNPLPAGLTSGQLTITRSNGNSTEVGLTVTVNPAANTIRRVPSQYATIQAAIDAANAGDLILVDPGIYKELPIMYKRVRLQGAGAGSTVIWASHFSSGPGFVNPLVAWRDKLKSLVAQNLIGLLPEQDPTQPDFFFTDGEGPGVFVAPKQNLFGNSTNINQRARIDGFKITLADLGGAVYVNAYASRLLISNNRITGNSGNLAGGIRVGNPTEVAFARGGQAVATSLNPEIDIRFNQIDQNGSLTMGGGIALFKGADGYNIQDNNVCGNLARSGGGGIAHRGLSPNGEIISNNILFNEVFQGNQPGVGLGIGGGGGGIEVAGDPAVGLVATPSGLTEGSGSVLIDKNLLQGNLGGSADGGGIALRSVNGNDVAQAPTTQNSWHLLRIFNNLIVNNVSGSGGAGISLQDAPRVQIVHNTIARNDSTATSVFAGIGTPPSVMQPSGIVSRAHSLDLQAILGADSYSVPQTLRRNIVSENRTFNWDPVQSNNGQGGLLPLDTSPVFWDLGVVGTAASECLSPSQSVLSSLVSSVDGCDYTGSDNTAFLPVGFVSPYFNDLLASTAADEGGNSVQVYYTPLGKTGDYHLLPTSPARNRAPAGGTGGLLGTDVDGQTRPFAGSLPDTGADEVQQ